MTLTKDFQFDVFESYILQEKDILPEKMCIDMDWYLGRPSLF